MKFCFKCKNTVPEEALFCPHCGASLEETEDKNSQKKFLAILSYFHILVLIPILAGKDSKFVTFHANQGLVLFLCSIFFGLINILKDWIGYIWIFRVSFIYLWIRVILYGADILLFAFAIAGIVYAAQGKKKELPLIGKIHLLNLAD